MVVEQEIDKLIKENKRSEVRKIVDEYKKQIKNFGTVDRFV